MAYKNIMLCHYQNYFNRIKKPLFSLEDYQKYQIGDWVENYNFNPNDGVTTEIIINWNEDIPDYAVIFDEYNKIESRWYIKDAVRNRSGQYKCALVRDVICDYFDQFMDSNSYIEKGYVPVTNPLIFNQEGQIFNQIKKKEKKLFDKTKTAWIVIYYDSKYPDTQKDLTYNVPQRAVRNINTFPLLDYLKNEDGSLILNKPIKLYSEIDYNNSLLGFNIGSYNLKQGIKFQPLFTIEGYYRNFKQTIRGDRTYISSLKEFDDNIIYEPNSIPWNENTKNHAISILNNPAGDYARPENINTVLNDCLFNFSSLIKQIDAVFPDTISNDDLERGATEIGTFVDNESKIYKISVISRKNITRNYAILSGEKPEGFTGLFIANGALFYSAKSLIERMPNYEDYINNNTKFYGNSMIDLDITQNEYQFYVEEVASDYKVIRTTLKPTMNALMDAPYKMMAIPLHGTFVFPFGGSTRTYTFTEDDAYSTCQMIINSLQPQQGGGGFIYDVQLLPYFPQDEWVRGGVLPRIEWIDNLQEDIDFTYVTNERADQILQVIMHPIKSKFTKNIKFDIPIESKDAYDFKVKKETEKYRLCSPNFANFQDFDPYCNKGVHFINIDCTYKPYTPYIKLNIDYDGLYGSDFNDDRGLICGGDYSLPMISDAWTSYQIQNKNYANIFERGSQHLETEFDISQTQRWTTALTSAGTAMVGGVGAALAGNPALAIGAGGGAAMTLFNTGVASHFAGEHFEENMAYRRDMYKFNLQNIQAKPSGLVRTSSFNYNNKLVPYIEVYESTEIEKKLFRNKLIFNGMTINAIDKPSSFIEGNSLTFLKGQLMRIQDVYDDSHICEAINYEFNMGFYI